MVVLAQGDGTGAPLGVAELREFWTQQGMTRHTCPERVEVVEVIPRNAMGKVLTQDLRRSLLAT